MGVLNFSESEVIYHFPISRGYSNFGHNGKALRIPIFQKIRHF